MGVTAEAKTKADEEMRGAVAAATEGPQQQLAAQTDAITSSSEDVDDREEGEIVDDYEFIISSDEELCMRQRIEELEAKNAELEKIANISGIYTNDYYDKDTKKDLHPQTSERFPLTSIDLTNCMDYKRAAQVPTDASSISSVEFPTPKKRKRRKSKVSRQQAYESSRTEQSAKHSCHKSRHKLHKKHKQIPVRRRSLSPFSTDDNYDEKDAVAVTSNNYKDYDDDDDEEEASACYLSRAELRFALARTTNNATNAAPSLKERLARNKNPATIAAHNIVIDEDEDDDDDDVIVTTELPPLIVLDDDDDDDEVEAPDVAADVDEELEPADVANSNDSMSLEEQELRLIALKSAVMKKHLARKKRDAEIAYSPTDFEATEATTTAQDEIEEDLEESAKNSMEISPVASPKLHLSAAEDEDGGGGDEDDGEENSRMSMATMEEESSEVGNTKPIDMDIANSASEDESAGTGADGGVGYDYDQNNWLPIEQIPLPGIAEQGAALIPHNAMNYDAIFYPTPVPYNDFYAETTSYNGEQLMRYEVPPPPPAFRLPIGKRDYATFVESDDARSRVKDFDEDVQKVDTNLVKFEANAHNEVDVVSAAATAVATDAIDDMDDEEEEEEALRALLLSKLNSPKMRKIEKSSHVVKEELLTVEERGTDASALKKPTESILKEAVRRLKMKKTVRNTVVEVPQVRVRSVENINEPQVRVRSVDNINEPHSFEHINKIQTMNYNTHLNANEMMDISVDKALKSKIDEFKTIHKNDIRNAVNTNEVFRNDIKGKDVINKKDVVGNVLHKNDIIQTGVMANDVVKNDVIKNDLIKNDVIKNDVIKKDVITNDVIINDVITNNVISKNVITNNVISKDVIQKDVIMNVNDVHNKDVIQNDVEKITQNDVNKNDIIDKNNALTQNNISNNVEVINKDKNETYVSNKNEVKVIKSVKNSQNENKLLATKQFKPQLTNSKVLAKNTKTTASIEVPKILLNTTTAFKTTAALTKLKTITQKIPPHLSKTTTSTSTIPKTTITVSIPNPPPTQQRRATTHKIVKPNKVINTQGGELKHKAIESILKYPTKITQTAGNRASPTPSLATTSSTSSTASSSSASASVSKFSATRLITSIDNNLLHVNKLIITLRASETETSEDELYYSNRNSLPANTRESASVFGEYYDNASPISLPMHSPEDTPSRANTPACENSMESDASNCFSPSGFEQKLDNFLKNVRSQVQQTACSSSTATTCTATNSTTTSAASAAKNVNVVEQSEKSSNQSISKNIPTPGAVRHLPHASQEEYRRLVHRMLMLEKKKSVKNLEKIIVKNTTNSPTTLQKEQNTATAVVAATKENLPSTDEHQQSTTNATKAAAANNSSTALIKKVLIKNAANGSAAQTSEMSPAKVIIKKSNNITTPQPSKANVLRAYESSFLKIGSGIMSNLDKSIKLVAQAKQAKIAKLRHEKRLKELRLEMDAIQRKLNVEQQRISTIYPEICGANEIISTLKQRRIKLLKAATSLGKSLKGDEYRLNNELKQEILMKSKKLASEIKCINSMQYVDIENMQTVVDEANELTAKVINTAINTDKETTAQSLINERVPPIDTKLITATVNNSENLPKKNTAQTQTPALNIQPMETEEIEVHNQLPTVQIENAKSTTHEIAEPPAQPVETKELETVMMATCAATEQDVDEENLKKDLNTETITATAPQAPETSVVKTSCVPEYRSPLMALKRSQKSELELDPNGIICPHDLMGQCEDINCEYLHLSGDATSGTDGS